MNDGVFRRFRMVTAGAATLLLVSLGVPQDSPAPATAAASALAPAASAAAASASARAAARPSGTDASCRAATPGAADDATVGAPTLARSIPGSPRPPSCGARRPPAPARWSATPSRFVGRPAASRPTCPTTGRSSTASATGPVQFTVTANTASRHRHRRHLRPASPPDPIPGPRTCCGASRASRHLRPVLPADRRQAGVHHRRRVRPVADAVALAVAG